MELMSSVFLCVLVALLSQTLGTARNKNTLALDVKFNKSVALQQKPTLRKGLLLNLNGPSLVNNLNELKSVFNDFSCKSCSICMERVIKAYSIYNRMSSNPSAEEFRDDVQTNEINTRSRRDAKTVAEFNVGGASKKSKTKKNRTHKAVTVTKYDVDGEVYALKVKETQVPSEQLNDKAAGTCQVYSVKKSFACESPEGEGLLLAGKRRANRKKSKKEHDKNNIASTTMLTHTSIFKKREVDNSQVPENFMTSLEDIY